MDYYKISPDGLKNMLGMELYLGKIVSLDSKLKELIKIRVSQINGCAYCITTHSKEARNNGETEQRIYGLNAWQECRFYSKKEQLALQLAENMTLISEKKVPDALYQEIRKEFNEKEYTDLVLLITQINSWNRISIAMGNIVG